MAVVNAWENQGVRDTNLNDIMKEIFQFIFDRNIDLHTRYIRSECNQSDAPSRKISYSDCMLTEVIWLVVQRTFGPLLMP